MPHGDAEHGYALAGGVLPMSETALTGTAVTGSGNARRLDQLTVLGFVTDQASEMTLRDGLNDLAQTGVSNTCDIRRGTVKAATAAMARMSAPQILVVDVSQEDRPLQALFDLCDVIEPSVAILVIGDIDDIDLYRDMIRQIGAVDYIFKPITHEMVARYFSSLITNNQPTSDLTRGGRVISVTGARGGVGNSTIAAALAWFLGVEANRHTLLLDVDPFIGTTQERFGVSYEPSLQMLLADADIDTPQTVLDAVRPVEGRFCVFGSPPDLDCNPDVGVGRARAIVEAVRMRFNFVILDLPFLPIQQHREFMDLTHHRVIVLDPSVAGLRDTLRLLAIPNSPGQPQRPTICLNREGLSGGLRRKHIEDGLKRKVDLALPDLPRTFSAIAAQPRFAGAPKGGPFARLIHDMSREVGFEPVRGSVT